MLLLECCGNPFPSALPDIGCERPRAPAAARGQYEPKSESDHAYTIRL
jgi:hypothetical protein